MSPVIPITDVNPDIVGAINRQAKNINEAQGNKFQFNIHKLPQTNWKVVSFNIPGMSIPVVNQNTNFNPVKWAGLKVDFTPLRLKFIIDEDWNDYLELHNWIKLSGMPKNSKEYARLIKEDPQQIQLMSPDGGLVSDAVGTILSNQSIPNVNVFYRNCFPYELSDVELTNDLEVPNVLTCTALFAYDYYDMEYVNPSGGIGTV